MIPIILASGSPRRAEILRKLDIPFIVRPQDIDESFSGQDPDAEALRLASGKLLSLLSSWNGPLPWAFAADTFILCDNQLIGKPGNQSEAEGMLSFLSGKEHSVITGLAFHSPEIGLTTAVAETKVLFGDLTPEEIDWYLETGEWQDAAGAYRIQDKGAVLIEGINGSWSNVMGLPIRAFYGMLRQHKYPF